MVETSLAKSNKNYSFILIISYINIEIDL